MEAYCCMSGVDMGATGAPWNALFVMKWRLVTPTGKGPLNVPKKNQTCNRQETAGSEGNRVERVERVWRA
jgi:hypothetical protein